MTTLTNIIDVIFQYDEINKNFVIVKITFANDDFKFKNKLLDSPDINAKAISYVYGKNAYILFDKDSFEDFKMADFEDKFSYQIVNAYDLFDSSLLSLFINSLANVDDDYNNITGKFYKVIKKYKTRLVALEFKVNFKINSYIYLNCSAVNFSRAGYGDADKPHYRLDGTHNSLVRIFKYDNSSNAFVRKNDYSNRKASQSFLNIKNSSGKAYEMHHIIKQLNETYGRFLTVRFLPLEITEKKQLHGLKVQTINKANFKKFKLALVDLTYDDSKKTEILKFKNDLESLSGMHIRLLKKTNQNYQNIVIVHNHEFYARKKLEDPYKKLPGYVIQCAYVENLKLLIKEADDNSLLFSAALHTILKELIIKNDIIVNHKITIDDWESYNFKNNWKFSTSNDYGKHIYSMVIKPSGDFEIFEEEMTTLNPNFYELNSQFSNSKTVKIIIHDDLGNSCKIEETNLITMPNDFVLKGGYVGRSKDFMFNNYPGLCDINHMKFLNEEYYNVGMDLKTIRTDLRNASHLYHVENSNVKDNLFLKMMDLMGVQFVVFNNLTVLPYPIKYLREYISYSNK